MWECRNGALTYDDLLHIGEQQIAAEESALMRANRFLFCDTSPLTTLFYSRHLFGRADPGLERLANRQYDSVVLCGTDFTFIQDGTRQEASFRDCQHAWYLAELARRNIPFLLVTGTVDERIAQVSHFLQNCRTGIGSARLLIRRLHPENAPDQESGAPIHSQGQPLTDHIP